MSTTRNPSKSTDRPGITQAALARRVFNEGVNRRLRETTIMRVLPDVFTSKKVALDIGAATGHYTTFLADHFERVVAFEPVTPVYSQLIKMHERHRNIWTMNVAVDNDSGMTTMFVDHLRLSNSGLLDNVHGPTQSVFTVALDDIFLDQWIDFIKIDVEGTELRVLSGAETILRKCKPKLLVEVYEPFSETPLGDIFTYLWGFGYRCAFYSHPDLVEALSISDAVRAVKERHAEHDGDFLFW